MIRTESLGVDYGAVTAFRDVSVSINPGSIFAIVGPSGCGKSSFLMTLNRMTDLIPGVRVSGRAFLGDENIHSDFSCSADLCRRVGMIFQKPNPFPMSIRHNVQLALREHGVRGPQLEERIEQVLTAVGLWDEVKDRMDSSALELSGGQQQRLCIARALALKPQVLLMDEPCSALDPIASAKVESLIESLRERYTVAIVTHNLAQARRLADQVAVFWMEDGAGRMIDEGDTHQMFTSAAHPTAAAYLAGEQG